MRDDGAVQRSSWVRLTAAAVLGAPVLVVGAVVEREPGQDAPVPAQAPVEETSAARPVPTAVVAPPSPTRTAAPSATASPSSTAPADGSGGSVAPAPGREVSVLDTGAVGDGRTDDTAALQRALDEAGPGDVVVLPAGRSFAHDDVVRVRRDGVTLTGGGTLVATEAARSTLWVEADGVTVSGITLEGGGGERGHSWDDTGLLLKGTTGVVVDGVTVRDATSAGVFVDGSSGFTLRGVVVEDSRADGIHITGGSADGALVDPVVRRSGDDGIAVVSYRDVETPVTGITVTSPRVETTTWGRGISVVGGRDVAYTDVFVEGSDAAALYFASEANWSTHATSGVTVDGGELVGSNTSEEVDHGALLVYSGDAARPVSDVRVSGLTIRDTAARASREVGVLGAPSSDIVLEDITVEGSERGLFVSTNDGSDLVLRDWTRNGDAVADLVQ